ncbi:MAG: hypothetical protein JOZ31_12015 [Verrucomicrobia bacterium]|nr:hypothetical protein [Verrucomicrobiota bacterium]MBV8484230.1 hypothetical protein [Verrucomicrobiota bacterium]
MRNLTLVHRHTLAAILAGCWLLVGIGRSDDTLPKGFDVARYQQIWERNPFTLVTPTLTGPASPFSKLILVNWLHDKGKDILFVEDTETNEVKKVTKEEGDNPDRLRLIEVVPNKNPSLIFAKLTNGKEEGIVKFKFEQAQNNQVVNPNLAMQRPIPGQPQVGPNGQQFGGAFRRGVPQTPTGVNQQNTNTQRNPVNAPEAQDVRRRRMLPTPPQNPVPQTNAPQFNGQQNNAQQNTLQQNNNQAASDDDDE